MERENRRERRPGAFLRRDIELTIIKTFFFYRRNRCNTISRSSMRDAELSNCKVSRLISHLSPEKISLPPIHTRWSVECDRGEKCRDSFAYSRNDASGCLLPARRFQLSVAHVHTHTHAHARTRTQTRIHHYAGFPLEERSVRQNRSPKP